VGIWIKAILPLIAPASRPLHFCGAVVRALVVGCCNPTPSKQKSVSRVVVGVSLAAIFVLWISGLIWAEIRLREQAMLDGSIEYMIGIEIATPYRSGREVIEFSRIVPGGAADKSGLRRRRYPCR